MICPVEENCFDIIFETDEVRQAPVQPDALTKLGATSNLIPSRMVVYTDSTALRFVARELFEFSVHTTQGFP